MNNDYTNFVNVLNTAAKAIESKYFHVKTASSPKLIYRERVYCYELYHQIKKIYGSNEEYTLFGEIDKAGQALFSNEKPDFVFHIPGNMNNFVVIEVKPLKHAYQNKKEPFTKDINTVKRFITSKNYQYGIIWLFGWNEKWWTSVKKILLREISAQERQKIKIFIHKNVGNEPEQMTLEDL